jgi:dethiobiotin synthetase
MACKAVMVAATRQHVGKTSVSMALLSGLRKRFDEVAYMKPVGQKYVLVENGIKVDKDIRVGKEHFQLSCAYEHMRCVNTHAQRTPNAHLIRLICSQSCYH